MGTGILPRKAANPSGHMQLHLLGGFDLRQDEYTLTNGLHRKAQALLAVLVMECGRPHAREQLANLLWPGLPADRSRNNLRQGLHQIRNVLGPHAERLLHTSRDAAQMRNDEGLWVDTQALRQALQPCTACLDGHDGAPPCGHTRQRMEAALALYHGDFLADLALDDSSEFERWRQEQSESLLALALTLAEKLCLAHAQMHNWHDAEGYARRAIALSPWNENLHCAYMQLLARTGRYTEALSWYQRLRKDLAEEFGVEPLPATRSVMNKLTEQASATGAGPAPIRPAWRQATVLCCHIDMPDARAEEALESLALARMNAAECLRRHGGHVTSGHDSYMIAYFGYPHACRDAGEQAGLAALCLREDLAVGFHLRTGLCTAPIISGNIPGVPDLDGTASRNAMILCRQSRLGEILVDRSSHTLLHEKFTLHALPGHTGDDSQPVTYVLETRMAQAHDTDPPSIILIHNPPLLERDHELARMREAWQAACEGTPQTLLIRGHAGMGKSRLLQTACAQAMAQHATVRRLHCRAQHRLAPLFPFVVLLESICGFTEGESSRQRRNRLMAYLEAHHPGLCQGSIDMLEALLPTIQDDQTSCPAQIQRQQTLDAARLLIGGLASTAPLLLTVEELQWADDFTLETLETIAHDVKDACVLLLMSAQNGNTPSWLAEDQILDLAPLSAQAERALVSHTAPGLSGAIVDSILARADGVPLFARELALAAARQQGAQAPQAPSLQFLMLTRIDSVPHGLRTLQLAATIGVDVPHHLLASASDLDEETLAQHLSELARAQLLARHPHDSDAWQFQHHLIQEVAYGSQIASDREDAHLRVAQALCEHFPARAHQRPVEVAQHFEASGSILSAIGWWRTAGIQALRLSATDEAIAHLGKALRLVELLQANPARKALELSLLLPLGKAFLAQYGYGAPQAIIVHERAWALCDEDTPLTRRFEATLGQWFISNSRPGSNFRDTETLARQLLELAQAAQLPAMLAHAWAAQTHIALWRNQPGKAIECAHACLARTTQTLDPEIIFDIVHPHINSLGHEAWAWATLGKPERAAQAARRCLELAQTLSNPHNECLAFTFATMLAVFEGNDDEVEALAMALGQCVLRHDQALWRGIHHMFNGWLDARAGKRAGAEALERAIRQLRNSIPSASCMGYFLMAQAWDALERPDRLARTIQSGIAAADSVSEGFFRARLAAMAERHAIPISPDPSAG